MLNFQGTPKTSLDTTRRARLVRHSMKSFNRLSATALIVAAAVTCLAAKPPATGPEPDAVLKNLYKAHDAQKGPFFDKENRALLEQYFAKDLAALIRKDAIASAGEVGALDFDPLYASQDPQATGFKIGKVNYGGILKHEGDEPIAGLATIDVTFKDSGKQVRIGFQIEQDPAKAWKIADIHYPDGRSLSTILGQ